MSSQTRAVLLAALLVGSGFGVLFVGGAGAATSATIDAGDHGSGNTTSHNVTATVDSTSSGEAGSSFNGFSADYNTSTGYAADLSGVSNDTIRSIGIDSDGDGTIDTNVHDDVQSVDITENGTKITVGLGGSYSLNGGDVIILRYENVTNPAYEGSYEVTVAINPQSSSATQTATLDITDATPPTIENFTLTNSGQDVNLVVETDDQLQTLDVTVSDDASKTLNISAFNESGSGTDWTYVADVSDNEDGDYTATLDTAVDDAGNAVDNPSASDTTTVDTLGIAIDGGNVTPDAVDSGQTVSQTVNVSVTQASKDGEPETVSITFNGSVSVTNATATADSAAVTDTTITNGNTTVEATVDSGDGGGTAAYTVSYDLNVTYSAQGNTTVPIDADAVDSDDGDSAATETVTSVYVRDATPPVISNYTLVTSGQNVDLTFNASEELGSVSVQLGDDASGTLTLSELNATDNGDHWTYRGDVSDDADGTFTADLGVGDAADVAGNTNEDSHTATATVNEVAIDVTNVTVTNDTVDPGATVDQTVDVRVQGVSLDGTEDTVQVVFPADAENVTLNGVSADTTLNNTSTTTNAAGETVLDATVNPGDGGGVTTVNVSYDVTATYPDSTEGELYPLNASAFDSDGDTDGPENHSAFVTVRNVPPEISNTTLFLNDATTQDVDLRFNSTEELATAQASFETDLAGTTLSLANGTLSGTQNADGTWTYTADVNEGDDGQFNVTVSGADAAGNAATGNRTASLRVTETDPVVVSATVSPNEVRPGETTTQRVTADVDGFSRESGVDTVLVTLGDGVDVQSLSNVSVTDENGNEASVSGSTVVDDGDGTNETVRVEVASGDGLGTANVSVAFDATVAYANSLEGSTLLVNATAEDSDGASDSATNLSQMRVVDTYPTLTNFSLNASGQDVDLSFDSDEELETITVDVDRDGQATTTLTRDNFTETSQNGSWHYVADVSQHTDGTFNATLATEAALDSTNNGNQNSHADELTVNENRIDVVAATVTPDTVDPQTTVTTDLTVETHNVSLDGDADTVRATLPNGTSATLHGASSDVGSVTGVTNENGTLVATVATGSDGGVADVNVTYNVTVTYPDALEGETLAVNASATDSDGDSDTEANLTQVRVRDTHPEIANFTLVNSTRDVDLTFNSSEELEAITVTVDGDVTTTLSRSNFTESFADGNWTYRADVSENLDGSFNATLAAGDVLDNTNNGNNESHSDALTVDTRAVNLTNATVTPDAVDPDTTVEQSYTLSATDFGQDGGTDTLTLDLNESLAVGAISSVTVESGEATVTGTELLDRDGDGANERVRLSLDTGATGGTTDVTVSLNATVSYPESTEETTLAVNASATDSDGDADAATNLTAVSVRGVPPTITNFSLNATGQDVDLSFDSDEELADIAVDLGGDLDGTLTESDLNETGSGDDWSYTANVSDGQDGAFEATLTTATDSTGNDGAAGQFDSVRVNEIGPTLRQTRLSPANVTAGEPTNQTVTTNVTGLSQDGLNDTVTLGFPNESAISLTNVTVTGDNATVANATVNGTDVLVNVSSGNATGTANVTLTTNVTATYDNATEGETLNLTAAVNDSDGEWVGPRNVTQVSVNDTVPNVTAFVLNATGQDVNLTVETNESVSTLNASLGGDLNETLTRENFTETYENGSYVYTANVSEGYDGRFNATLTNATDPYNNSAVVGQNDSLVVDTLNVSADSLNATPDTVRPNETVEQTVALNVTNVRQDGLNDTATFAFENETDVLNATAAVNGSTVATNVSDLDADGFNETVEVTLNTSDELGTTNFSVVLNTTTYYNGSLEGQNVTVTSAVNDSDGSNASVTGATAVTVRNTVPNVSTFDVALNDSTVTLTLTTNERLETVAVALNGTIGGTLTRADFLETRENGSYVYTTTLAEDIEGRFNATLTAAVDAAGNDGAANQTDEITYHLGGGGQQQAGGGGGQQQQAGDEPTTADPEPTGASPSVIIEQVTDGERVVLQNGLAGLSVAGHVTADATEAAAGVHLSDVRYTATENGTVSLTVTHDAAGEGLPVLPDGVAPAMFYHVEADGVTDSEYTFGVDEARLGDRSPSAVEVYGLVDGEWTTLDATHVGERGDFHSYTVAGDTSALAVALSGANVSVTDATVMGETVNASENPANVSRNSTMAFVNVTVENTGPIAGNVTLNVTADGSTVATRTVTVAANSTRTVQMVGDVGAVNTSPPVVVVEVNGAEAGTLPGPETMAESGDGSGTSTDAPGFGAVAALAALAVGALLARRD